MNRLSRYLSPLKHPKAQIMSHTHHNPSTLTDAPADSMNPQQPPQGPFSDIFADIAAYTTTGYDPRLNGVPPAPQQRHQTIPIGFYGNMAGVSVAVPQSPSGIPSPPGVLPPPAGVYAQVAPHPHTAAHSTPFPVPDPRFTAPVGAAPRYQQPAPFRPPPPPPVQGGSRPYPAPQPPTGARDVQAHYTQVYWQRPMVVPSQAPPARTQATSTPAPAPYHAHPMQADPARPAQMQVQHASRPQRQPYQQAQIMYAPPPFPPPGWIGPPRVPGAQPPRIQTQLAPPRDESASPWTPLFTPSPAMSTPATTPGWALTPSPAVGRTVPLPTTGPFVPQRAATGQQPAHGVGAAPSGLGGHTLKRRISDSDPEACEPGPSKRPATQTAVQARSTSEDTIGRQVQSNNNSVPTQRAPASVAPTTPEPAAIAAASENKYSRAVGEDDDSSLFGDCDEEAEVEVKGAADEAGAEEAGAADEVEEEEGADVAALAAELEAAINEECDDAVPAEGPVHGLDDEKDDATLAKELADALNGEDDGAGPAEEPVPVFDDAALAAALEAAFSSPEEDAETSQATTTPRAPPSPMNQLWLPGMDKASTAHAGATGHLPDLEPAQVPRLCLPGTDPVPEGKVVRTGPKAHLPPASEPAASPDARKRKGKKRAGTAQAPSAASGPSHASGSSTAGSSSRGKQTQAQPLAPQPPKADVRDAVARENEAKRVRKAGHAARTQNPELFKGYSWLSGAGPSTMAQGPSTAPLPAAATPAPATAAAPASALPVFTRPPPDLGPKHLRPVAQGKPSPMSGYAPKNREYWCKMCWEARAARMFWFNYRGLRAHVRGRHPELLDSDVWRH
ncbi:hypothetical protein AURDEDRAFT_130175 [Auricularia subglabra TFB-10046 SS5]|uniref:Uncharacterized protein n=1 Tax=Auricularia subglabra (strain TFB-10046 / SS5) TaxID=717982 RepID=J0WU59_AURST|nr:hypothetical protein AURDEDRAFT_130175 [Auricularia subglabra TFB-10046 SS5]